MIVLVTALSSITRLPGEIIIREENHPNRLQRFEISKLFSLSTLCSLHNRLDNFKLPSHMRDDPINLTPSQWELIQSTTESIDNILIGIMKILCCEIWSADTCHSFGDGLSSVLPSDPHSECSHLTKLPFAIRSKRTQINAQRQRNSVILDMVRKIRQMVQDRFQGIISEDKLLRCTIQTMKRYEDPNITSKHSSTLRLLSRQWKNEIDTLQLQQQYKLEGRVDELTTQRTSMVELIDEIVSIKKLSPSNDVIDAASRFLNLWHYSKTPQCSQEISNSNNTNQSSID